VEPRADGVCRANLPGIPSQDEERGLERIVRIGTVGQDSPDSRGLHREGPADRTRRAGVFVAGDGLSSRIEILSGAMKSL
jgi:hypothetical protein